MTINSFAARLFASSLLLLAASVVRVASAQGLGSTNTKLPSSAELSDVEIRWQSGGGDGCVGVACAHYRITMRGDGLVALEELGWGERPPQAATRTRQIELDQFVDTVNQLLKARFLDAPDNYDSTRVARRNGRLLHFYASGGVGAGWVDLTLRAGSFEKTVRIGEAAPAELRQAKELVWRIAGPGAWAAARPHD